MGQVTPRRAPFPLVKARNASRGKGRDTAGDTNAPRSGRGQGFECRDALGRVVAVRPRRRHGAPAWRSLACVRGGRFARTVSHLCCGVYPTWPPAAPRLFYGKFGRFLA